MGYGKGRKGRDKQKRIEEGVKMCKKGREKERRIEGGGEIWKRGKEKGLGRSKREM